LQRIAVAANTAMMTAIYAYFMLTIVLDHAHLVCPISLAWGNRGFRAHMLERPEKFILLPALCIFMAVAIGLSSKTTHDPAFRLLAATYVWWNAWHFGSQHFGVASLLGWRSGPRWLRRLGIILSTMLLMLVPINSLLILMVNELISFAHWTTDIGLSTWAGRWRISLLVVLLCGVIGFLWKTVVSDPHLCGVKPACTAVWSVPLLLSLRYGLGFWHFLMSRWVWKLGDPQVRATIGKKLLA
jgi:hypothetical protein